MMTEAQVGVLRDQMSAIADIALACDAKVGNCDDIEERATIVQEHAAKIALAALALCPPERLADVAAIWNTMEKERAEYKTPKAVQDFLFANPPFDLPGGLDGVGVDGGWLADMAKAARKESGRLKDKAPRGNVLVIKTPSVTAFKTFAAADRKLSAALIGSKIAELFDGEDLVCTISFEPKYERKHLAYKVVRSAINGMMSTFGHRWRNRKNRKMREAAK